MSCSNGDDTDSNDIALGYVLGTVNQNKDPERLRTLMTDELDAQTTDVELADTLRCIPISLVDVLVGREVQRDGDTATITATYEVSSAEGGDDTRRLERVWEFQRVEDGWLLSGLPSCSYA